MSDILAPLEDWLRQAAAALDPAARQTVLAEIGRELRSRIQRRILAQTGPDGEAWPARKPDARGRPRLRATHGTVRSTSKMLLGLRETRRLALRSDQAGLELGYAGRTAALAAVHHHGLVDAVAKGGPQVKYPARPLLGLAPEDLAYVRDRLMAAIIGDKG